MGTVRSSAGAFAKGKLIAIDTLVALRCTHVLNKLLRGNVGKDGRLYLYKGYVM